MKHISNQFHFLNLYSKNIIKKYKNNIFLKLCIWNTMKCLDKIWINCIHFLTKHGLQCKKTVHMITQNMLCFSPHRTKERKKKIVYKNIFASYGCTWQLVLNDNWASIVLTILSLERLTEEARLRKKVCDMKIYLCENGLSCSASPLCEWAPVLMIIAVRGFDYSSLMVSAC